MSIDFSGKKVLVTGGTGMIGRQLVSLLLKRGADITVASLDEGIGLPDSVRYIHADLRYFSACQNICSNQDYVFNLIGVKASPKMTRESPASCMVPVLQFNTNMMEAAREAGAKWYLYTSTVGVYEPAEVFKEGNVWETFPSKNDWFGGWAKRMGELQAQAYSIQYGWDQVSIVRPANVYGPYDNFDPENAMVIPSLIRKAFDNDTLSVWGNGSAIRDFIHAHDVARGMLHMVDNQVTEPVNLGSGDPVSIKTIAETIVDKMPKDIDIEWDLSKPSGDSRRLFDMSRAFGHGFKPEVSIAQGIEETIAWYADNRNWVNQRYNVFKQS